ncbi:MAG TPA: hypothetical protein VJN02_05980 [Gammaproteobacteria bacterium]|nr:hypothetical protein [Gammaproteobacteria bacterium]
MQILKSLGDGIGTAAGVAWSIFGIVFGTLGLTIGTSMIAIILGCISVGLFLLVCLPITYWSYKNHLKENNEVQRTLQEQEDKLCELLFNYLLAISKKILIRNKYINVTTLVENIKNKIQVDIIKHQYISSIAQSLNDLLDNREGNSFLFTLIDTLLNDNENNIVKEHLQEDMRTICKKYNNFIHTTSNASAQIKMGMINFLAAFGSVAGCAAGTLGLLGSMGVFTSFAAVPILGWSILGVAVIFGLAVAGICIHSSYEKNKKSQLIDHYKQVNSELTTSVTRNNIKTSVKRKANISSNYSNKKPDDKTKKSHSVDFDYFYNHLIWHDPNSLHETTVPHQYRR